MIVEYFGIPGGGKTFQANLYKKELKSKGLAFWDISRHKGTPLYMKVLYKIADVMIYVLPKYRRQIYLYREICRDCKKDVSRLDGRIHNIVLFLLVYDMIGSINRIIINDEGQLHWILSLCANNGCPVDRILSVYLSDRHSVVCRCVDVTVDTAFHNIRQRNRHVCYIDEMRDEALIEYLSSFYKTNKEIIKQIDTEIINVGNL